MQETYHTTPRALGLPPGSVRALLALTLVGLVLQQVLVGQPVGLLLSEAVLIILAHYFTSRRVLELSPALQQRLEQEGLLLPEPNPLWLPKHSVRTLILSAFCITTVVLLWQGRLLEPGGLETIGLLFAYLGGIVSGWFGKWRRRTRTARPGIWIHLRAIIVLLACLGIILAAMQGGTLALPGWLENLLLSIVLFYFGAR